MFSSIDLNVSSEDDDFDDEDDDDCDYRLDDEDDATSTWPSSETFKVNIFIFGL
jgi:hypothetical protein